MEVTNVPGIYTSSRTGGNLIAWNEASYFQGSLIWIILLKKSVFKHQNKGKCLISDICQRQASKYKSFFPFYNFRHLDESSVWFQAFNYMQVLFQHKSVVIIHYESNFKRFHQYPSTSIPQILLDLKTMSCKVFWTLIVCSH